MYVPRKYSSLDSSIFCLLDSNGMAHLLYCRLGHRSEFFYLESQFEFLIYSSINFYEFLRPHRPYFASHFNVRCAVAWIFNFQSFHECLQPFQRDDLLLPFPSSSTLSNALLKYFTNLEIECLGPFTRRSLSDRLNNCC